MGTNTREISVDGDIAYVPLNRGYQAVIDADMAPKVGQYDWRAFRRRDRIYPRAHGRIAGKPMSILLHRLVMGMGMRSPYYDAEVDHIDGDPLNNRRANLRLVTSAQNSRNSRKTSRRRTSIYKGVCFDRRSKRWVSNIRVNGGALTLGHHATPEDAARAYDAAAALYFGAFARTNIMMGLLAALAAINAYANQRLSGCFASN